VNYGLQRLAGLALLLLSACGGGGGNPTPPQQPPDNQPRLTLSASSISFQLPSPFEVNAPAAVTLQGNISPLTGLSGTLYILIDAGDPAIISVDATNFVVANTLTGSLIVTPTSPTTHNPGVYQTAVAVTACMNSPNCSSGVINGSPFTVPVTYTVPSNVVRAGVAPGVVLAMRSTAVVLRGSGFNNVTSVQFGGAAATTFTRISDTEIHATVPSLAAGSYPVSINGGSIPFPVSLAVVTEPAYAPAQLNYPTALDSNFGVGEQVVYDSLHNAFFVLVRESLTRKMLYRYAYTTSWAVTASLDVTTYRDLDLSFSGDRLYLTLPDRISVLDPVTLQSLNTISRPAGLSTVDEFRTLALANDGYAAVTMLIPSSGPTLFMMSTVDFKFTRTPCCATGGATPLATADGSRVAMNAFDFNNSYIPSTAHFVGDLLISPAPLVPRAFGCTVFQGGTTQCDTVVNRANNTILGYLAAPSPGFTSGSDLWATVAYTLDAANVVNVWNITALGSNGKYPLIGSHAVANYNGNSVQDTLAGTGTLDGHTQFVATRAGVLVIPIP
jgi:hypothetical protein